MNIILVSNARKNSFKIVLKPAVVCLVLAGVLFSGTAVFYSGYQLAVQDSENIVDAARQRTTSAWQSELDQQESTLQELKTVTEKSLDAMAGRLSMLQGYVMRLDALGSRLAVMADLDDIEFGIDNPPGVGGPLPVLRDSQMHMSDLLNSLDELEYALKDRSDKLSAMESMLINRTLQEQTAPGGRPADGGYMSSLYGYRTDPMSGRKEFHEGLDFAGRTGTRILAVAAGIVTWSGKHFGYGNLIEISHGNGYITRYAHNKQNLVNIGEKVEKGDVIATMGTTGRSTGTHVHFEVIHNGRHVDPRKYLSLN
ncbi:MAG: M23 family metallopeptidase [Gammaproteobacteria bacterium]